jgi:predicted DNA-binding transcriptional regulator AlpA
VTGEKEYEFLFVVDGLSMDDDEAVAVLTDSFDAVLSWNRGRYRLAVSGEGADPLDALGRLLSHISVALPGLRILRLDSDLVGISDIAQRIGHSRQNVQQWVNGERNGSRPFPPPEGCAGRSLVWRWADVNGWLTPLGLGDEAARPSREESVRIDVMLLDWNRARAGQWPVPALSLLCDDKGTVAWYAGYRLGEDFAHAVKNARNNDIKSSPCAKSSRSSAPPWVPGRGLCANQSYRVWSRPARMPPRPGTAWAALATTYGAVQGDEPPQAGRETTGSAP